MADLVAIAVFGGIALITGAAATYFLGTTVARRLVVLGAGVGLVAGISLASIFSTDPNACSDCEEFFGGAVTIFTLVFLVGNSVGWAIGAAIGSLLSYVRAPR